MSDWRLYLVGCIPRTSPQHFFRIPVHATSKTKAAITGRIIGELTGARLAALHHKEQ